MRDFAHPLPALVIADMLVVDPDDQDDFVRWADDIAAFIGNPHSSFETALQAQASLVALTGYFRALLSDRRRDRGGDLVSLLIELEEDGDIADDDDILAQCSLLLFAGHETTRNLLGNGLLALLNHPEQ
jgi:cytochrome P450